MKQETAKHLADGLTTLAVSTGTGSGALKYFEFIEAHSGALGFLSATFFGFAGLIFYFLTWRKSTLADENKRQIKLIEAKMANNIDRIEGALNKVVAAVNKQNKGN